MLVLKADGSEVDRTMGYVPTGEFIETVDGYHKGVGTLKAMLAEEPKKGADAAFLYKLGTKLYAHKRLSEADSRFARVVEVDPKNASGDADDALLERAGVSAAEKDWKTATVRCRDLVTRWPDSDLVADALVALGWYAANGGMKKEAASAYKEYLSRWPEGDDAEFVTKELKELDTPAAY